jgi:hypothetical protein
VAFTDRRSALARAFDTRRVPCSDLQVARDRETMIAAALMGVGFAATLMIVAIQRQDGARRRARPAASGEVGVVAVYGRVDQGLLRLPPSTVTRLPRPQDLSFQLTADGTGPRVIKIEMETDVSRTLMVEERAFAPAKGDTLEYLLHLDQTAPDAFRLIVTVEAPHAMAASLRYGVRLTGSGG